MHPKYWTRPRVMAPLEGEGGVGGAPAAEDFAAFFDNSAGSDDDQQAAQTPQASTESDEDAAVRLAAEEAATEAERQPGQQQDGEPTDETGTAEPQKFKIEVDGKPVELTAAEIAEHYKNGLRQQDYTKKTMEAAETRKAAEAQQAEARAQRDQYAAKLEQAANLANYEVSTLRARLTQELLDSDPVAYLQIERTANQRQAQIDQAQQELQQLHNQRQQEQAATAKSHMEAQHQALLDKLPEWRDATKAEAEAAQIKKFLADQGFKPEEMQFTDHRAILLARKAMQYDALMARAKTTQTKVAAAPPKVARPGTPVTSPTDGRTAAMRDLAKTGSREAAARVFADMFG